MRKMDTWTENPFWPLIFVFFNKISYHFKVHFIARRASEINGWKSQERELKCQDVKIN